MIFQPEMLDILQSATASAWNGTVYRHMFGSHPPARANTGGARWNAPGLAAIYASCERETALAEADYYISLQPLPPRVKRTLFTIRVLLKNVVNLTGNELLPRLGITDDVLCSIDQIPCRTIGAAVSWLGHDGLLVPSARRRGGTNLVIFQQDLVTSIFEVTGEEVIEPAQ
ncbi:MAG TPA: RES family NAD+ phosphorylase [Thermoanaerobaculia bacterium]|jgi:RES domain-containing protein|nr:RES family NAD+ phosphorylase [Thermoanaerobaculia bacterium]